MNRLIALLLLAGCAAPAIDPCEAIWPRDCRDHARPATEPETPGPTEEPSRINDYAGWRDWRRELDVEEGITDRDWDRIDRENGYGGDDEDE